MKRKLVDALTTEGTPRTAAMKAALFQIVQNATELCRTDEEAGRDELDRAEEWAEFIGSPSDLAKAIQYARDNCSWEEVQVVIKADYYLGDIQWGGSYGNAFTWLETGADEDPWDLQADTAPPLMVLLSVESANVLAEVASPGDGTVFTFNASAYASVLNTGEQASAGVFFRAWMYIPSPGSLEVELNHEWGTATGTVEASWDVSISRIEGNFQVYLGGDECSSSGGCGYLLPISVPSAGIYVVHAGVLVRGDLGEWGYASGSGRVVTIRWVPGPQ